MKKENQLLEVFQVEELEKRYEMGWIRVSAANSPTGTNIGTGETEPMTPGLSNEP